jgi:Icc-related predicted phosphoesterase
LNMRLLIVSDLHGQSSRIPLLSSLAADGTLDVLIVCGDITHFGSMEDASRILKEFAKVATTLFIPGNCDPPELALVSSVEGTTNIHGKCLSLNNIDFVGVGGSVPTPFRTPLELDEEDVESLLRSAAKQCSGNRKTVLVSHVPPYGSRADRVFPSHHVGSRAVRSFMENTRPLIVACGHIHESRVVESVGLTTIVNPGPLHKGYYALARIGDKTTVDLGTL